MLTKSIIAASVLSLTLMTAGAAVYAGDTINVKANKPEVNVTCMQNAVEKRDNALVVAVDAYHTSVRGALLARRDALQAAWEKTERKERRAALKAAWQTYKETRATAGKALKEIKRASWQTYKIDWKACGYSGASDDKTGAGVDAQL